MSAARTPFAADLVMIADYAGDKIPPTHAKILYLAADGFDAVTQALKLVRNTVGDLRGGFAPGVDPARWVEQTQAVADAALEQVSA